MDNFDKNFNRIQSLAIGWIIFCAIAAVALTGFGIWAVIQLIDILRAATGS